MLSLNTKLVTVLLSLVALVLGASILIATDQTIGRLDRPQAQEITTTLETTKIVPADPAHDVTYWHPNAM